MVTAKKGPIVNRNIEASREEGDYSSIGKVAQISQSKKDFDEEDEEELTVTSESVRAYNYLLNCENAFENLVETLSPIIKISLVSIGKDKTRKESNEPPLVTQLSYLADRLYELQHNLQQLPNFIQL